MRLSVPIGFFAPCLLAPLLALSAEPAPDSLEAPWDAGAETCAAGRPLEPIHVHHFNARTIVLRQNLCSTWEAPFLYLLIGDKQALLIDTGDIADPSAMPLESTVMRLLPGEPDAKMPLIVVHSHGHLDHRAGGVHLVPADLQHVRKYFGFDAWPNGSAQIDLGDRIIDVLPAPGHHPAQLVYYDRNSGLVFSGDFLLPGRILVDDLAAYQASARGVAAFLKDKPVSYVLGGHVEKNRAGELFSWQSTFHPDEHPLQLTKADLMALPAALREFNGLYTKTGPFIIENPVRMLVAVAVAAAIVLVLLGILTYRFFRRRARRVQNLQMHRINPS